jgi:predicted transcriptional regulator
MDIVELKKIGLTEGEVRIYDALLELGETTRTELSQKSGISPSKIYDVANRMLKKGIISAVKKNSVLHFSAADPERLKDFVEKKESEIDHQKKLVDQLLPTLFLKYQKTKEEVDVEVFYGWEGMKTAYNDIIKSVEKGEENCIFGASMGGSPKQADIFFSQYYKQEDKKGFKTRIIFNENLREYPTRTRYFTEHRLHEVKYLFQDTFTELNIYKNKVLIVMLLSKPIVIKVTNKEAADSCRVFFESMWNEAKI